MEYLDTLRQNLEQFKTLDVNTLAHEDNSYENIVKLTTNVFDMSPLTEYEMSNSIAELYEKSYDVLEVKAIYDSYIRKAIECKTFVLMAPIIPDEVNPNNSRPSEIAITAAEEMEKCYAMISNTYHSRHYSCKLKTGTTSQENTTAALSIEREEMKGEVVLTAQYEMLQYFLNTLVSFGAKRKVVGKDAFVYMPKKVMVCLSTHSRNEQLFLDSSFSFPEGLSTKLRVILMFLYLLSIGAIRQIHQYLQRWLLRMEPKQMCDQE